MWKEVEQKLFALLFIASARRRENMGEALFIVMLVVMLVVVALFVMTSVFEALWNTTMPQLFNLKLITFWQAFRLLLLAGLLTGGGFIHYNFGH